MAASRGLTTRLSLLEAQLKELRRSVEKGARYGQQVSSEVLYRMWQTEREDNIRLRMLMEERSREHEAFRDRVVSGLQLLYDRANDVIAKLAVRPAGCRPIQVEESTEDLGPAERRILEKFSQELQKGIR